MSCCVGSSKGAERLGRGRGEGEEYVGGVRGVIDSDGDGGPGAGIGSDGESKKEGGWVVRHFS